MVTKTKGQKRFNSNKKYQSWSIKIYGLVQLILVTVVTEINQIFEHKTPKSVLMRQVEGNAEENYETQTNPGR